MAPFTTFDLVFLKSAGIFVDEETFADAFAYENKHRDFAPCHGCGATTGQQHHTTCKYSTILTLPDWYEEYQRREYTRPAKQVNLTEWYAELKQRQHRLDCEFLRDCGIAAEPEITEPDGTVRLLEKYGIPVTREKDEVTTDLGDIDLAAIEKSVTELIEYVRGEAEGKNLYHARTRERLWNKAVRQAYLMAAHLEFQRKPFNIFGRGHEARVTLCREDAAILRGVASLPSNPLHRVYIAGFGAKHYYSKRLIDTAECILAEFKKELQLAGQESDG